MSMWEVENLIENTVSFTDKGRNTSTKVKSDFGRSSFARTI